MIFEYRLMKTGLVPLLSLLATMITGCSGSSSDAAPASTYSVTITDIQIKRTADQLDMSVDIPSEKSAVISVQ